MWKQKLGMSLCTRQQATTEEALETVRMVKAAGFDAVSPEWNPAVSLDKVIALAQELGLEIQSLHGPFDHVDTLWSRDGKVSGPALKETLDALDACGRLGIPIMVLHAWIGFRYTFEGASLYFGNFDTIVEKAEEYGVQIAFENTEGIEYLFALMDHFRDRPSVGYCWDSGHELCYNQPLDLLAKLGDRLIMTHINDNLGVSRYDGVIYWTDDLHLLPYDGIADWDYNIERLRKSRHMDVLNFEVSTRSKPNRHENDIYVQMGYEQFYAESYKRACRIAFKYSK